MMHILLIHQAFAALGEPGGTRHHEISRHLVAQGHQVTAVIGQVSYLTGRRTARGWLHRVLAWRYGAAIPTLPGIGPSSIAWSVSSVS
jgi:hypothetical protein